MRYMRICDAHISLCPAIVKFTSSLVSSFGMGSVCNPTDGSICIFGVDPLEKRRKCIVLCLQKNGPKVALILLFCHHRG